MDRLAVVIAVLVLSGCVAPTAGNTDATNDTTVASVGEAVPPGVNETRTFARVNDLLNAGVAPPERVRYVRPNGTEPPDAPESWRALGVERETNRTGPRLNAAVNGLGMITVSRPANASAAAVERVLAHEFVHYVQVKRRVHSRLLRGADSADGAFAVRAVVEGAAVVVADAYARRYLDAAPNHRLYAKLAKRLPDGGLGSYRNLRYRAGWRYVEGRAGLNVSAVYANPPETSEAVLHGLPPGADPPTALPVNATGPWTTRATPRLGEAFLRTALAGPLNESAARRAAAGWGNDTLRTFYGPNETAYAWVLRFDSPAASETFASLAEPYVAERRNATGGASLVRADARTVVVRIGPRSGRLTVNGTDPITVGAP